MLDDPVNATYTHTLTGTGRQGGQYQCTVSNNKPSNASASFTVRGKRECKERARERENIHVHHLLYIWSTHKVPHQLIL